MPSGQFYTHKINFQTKKNICYIRLYCRKGMAIYHNNRDRINRHISFQQENNHESLVANPVHLQKGREHADQNSHFMA